MKCPSLPSFGSLLLLQAILGLPAGAVTVTIDASKSNLSASPLAISPLIYGDNGNNFSSYDASAGFPSTTRTTTLKLPLLRLGGDLFSTYNWQIDAQNHDFTNYFESLRCDNQSTPDATITTNGQLVDSFMKFCQSTGAAPMITVQMFPYLANLALNRAELYSFPVSDITNGQLIDGTFFDQAGFGIQGYTDYNNNPIVDEDGNAGDGRSYPTGTDLTLTAFSNMPNTIAYIPYVPNTSTIQQNFLSHMTSTYGTATSGGAKYYILDNEPGDWCDTHFDVFPTGIHTAAYLSLFGTYSQMVKTADPNALVVAPEDTAWYTFFYSGYDVQQGSVVDGVDPAGQNGAFYYPYLLSQFKTQSSTAGKRLLDYLSFHYYAQTGRNNGIDVTGDDDSTATDQLRNQSTRELWDPNYASPDIPNPMTFSGSYAAQIIPRMKGWIQTGYPGTKLAITEYGFGNEQAINGATTQADILGIFGAYGVDLATRFASDQAYTNLPISFTDLAIQMYTNYDAAGSHFGDMSVSDVVPDTEPNPQVTFTGRDLFASYAAKRTSDGALTVMVINKALTGSTPVTVSLSNFTAGTSAQAYQLTSSGSITKLANVSVAANALTSTVPAESVTLYIIPATTTKTAQTITFPPIASQAFTNTITLNATASSGLPVTYSAAGPATVSGSTLHMTGTGTVAVKAYQAGNATYAAAPEAEVEFTAEKGNQTITFPTPANQPFNGPKITLGATASSGLAVTYTVAGPATLSGSVLTLTGPGTVAVKAYQAGNSTYNVATNVQVKFTALKGTQTITFPTPANQPFNGPKITLGATASSKLAVTYTVSGPATLSGSVLTLTGPGTVAVKAYQAGNATYSVATNVEVEFTSLKATQTITFPTIGNQKSSATVALKATASSGLAVTYLVSGPAKVTGTTLSFTGTGTVEIQATQMGNATYSAAPVAGQKFSVTP